MSAHTPLRLALVGAGNRANGVYGPILPHLREWLDLVAVCDPMDLDAVLALSYVRP